MSLKGKLSRMKGYISTEEKERDVRPGDREKDSSENPWETMGFKPYHFDGEHSLIRRKTYPVDHRHGNRAFRELLSLREEWTEVKGHPLSIANTDVENLLFFDTETTGLSSGAGTTIFLMGYARIRGSELEVVQHFMPGPASEAAFFHGFLSDFSADHSLVSYNGKAFDWPHVKSRHAFVREEVPKLPPFGHFDLLHAARRLWKQELPSCRLSIVEEKKLGIKRVNETPGSLAPILYFEYLQHRNPDELEGIIRHHEQDLLSLVSLYIELSRKLLSLDGSGTREHAEMGRWFEKLKIYEKAEWHYRAALTAGRSPEAAVNLALLSKKKKNYRESEQLLKEAADSAGGQSAIAVRALTELSKLYEHQYKSYEQALEFAGRALLEAKRAARTVRSTGKKDPSLEKRVQRLETKLDRGVTHR
ncbi:ribonuclease H-like domain-containing protein [Alteribacter natronophilus]|uniref:ribonuclease H-like domain-containing protein n=1 Tax=Alteribacter natronophilus TaxID=2583810 RepID=UPI00110E4563|nr:ribonuclease H-like domain-containing protein [Alteribacter natronophilus]TMW73370.1 hypothetical protein FGB90_03420 [Alteribacter natronophilus]